MLRNRLLQIGCDECLNDHSTGRIVFIQHSLIEQRLGSIPGKQRTDLIPSQQFQFAVLCPNGRAHAIAVWIGGDHKIGIFLSCEIHRHSQRLGIFGVRRLDRWKSSIETILLGHDLEIEPEPLQHGFYDYGASPMERSVDNAQRFHRVNNLWVENQCVEPLHVRLINLLADGRHFALFVAW